jgi:hypothetical protein
MAFPEQTHIDTCYGEELAERLDCGVFLSDHHEQGLGFNASGEPAVEPSGWVHRSAGESE